MPAILFEIYSELGKNKLPSKLLSTANERYASSSRSCLVPSQTISHSIETVTDTTTTKTNLKYEMTKVIKKRRLKMKRHKYRKRMKSLKKNSS